MLSTIVEISLRRVRLPKLLLLLTVLLDERIAAAQVCRALRVVGQGVMNHMPRVTRRPERFIDALRRQRIIGLSRIAHRQPRVTTKKP